MWLESRAMSRTECPVLNEFKKDSKVFSQPFAGDGFHTEHPSAGAARAALAFLPLEGMAKPSLKLLFFHFMHHFASPKHGERLIWWCSRRLSQVYPLPRPEGSCSSGHRVHPWSNPPHVLCASERTLPSSMTVAVITQIICSTVTSSQRCHLKLKIHVKTRDVTLPSRQFRPELVSQCLDSLPTCWEELSQGTRGCLALQLTVFHLQHRFAVEIQASNSLGFNLSTFY